MASPDPSTQNAVRKQKKGPPFKFLVPLIYAPVLPLIRLSLRHKPVLRDRLFTTVLVNSYSSKVLMHTKLKTSSRIPTLRTDLYDSESK